MHAYNADVGLDIPNKTISVAITEAGRNGECRSYGTIGNTRSRSVSSPPS